RDLPPLLPGAAGAAGRGPVRRRGVGTLGEIPGFARPAAVAGPGSGANRDLAGLADRSVSPMAVAPPADPVHRDPGRRRRTHAAHLGPAREALAVPGGRANVA